jgi:hypothetical protein
VRANARHNSHCAPTRPYKVLHKAVPPVLEEPRSQPDRKNQVVVLLLPPCLIAVVAGEGDLDAEVQELAEKGRTLGSSSPSCRTGS